MKIMSENIKEYEQESTHKPQPLSDAEQVERMRNIARGACAGVEPTFICWVEELAARESGLRRAVEDYLPLLEGMASLILSPKDNSVSRAVQQFKLALGPVSKRIDTLADNPKTIK